jgi:hypothetical protein
MWPFIQRISLLLVLGFIAPSTLRSENPRPRMEDVSRVNLKEQEHPLKSALPYIPPEGDFKTFPLASLDTLDHSSNLPPIFQSFLQDPRNAGLTPTFLKQWNRPALKQLKTGLLDSPKILELFKEMQISEESKALFFQGLTDASPPSILTLAQVLNHFPQVFSKSQEKLRFLLLQATRQELAKLNMGETLLSRLSFLETLNQSLEPTGLEPLQLSAATILSWELSRPVLERLILAQPETQIWKVEQKLIYNSLASRLNSEVSYTLEGTHLSGKLGQTFLRLNQFHQREVSAVLSHLENDFLPYMEDRVRQDPTLLSRTKTTRLVHEIRTRSKTISDWKNKRSALILRLNGILVKQNLTLESLETGNPSSLKQLIETLALKGASTEEQQALLEVLEELTKAHLGLSYQASLNANRFQDFYKTQKQPLKASKLRLTQAIRWLQAYNASHERNYGSLLSAVAKSLKQGFPQQFIHLNAAFQAMTSQCLSLFPELDLAEIGIHNGTMAEEFAGDFTTPFDSLSEKRQICLADYEIAIRKKSQAGGIEPLFDDGLSSFKLSLKDLENGLTKNSPSFNPKNSEISLFEPLLRLLKQQSPIRKAGPKLGPLATPAVEWAATGKVGFPGLSERLSTRHTLNLGLGVVHNLSGVNVYKPRAIELSFPNQEPFWKGFWLGITLGDQWLIDRSPTEKGKGGGVLLRALEPYMKKTGAQEFFIRRNLGDRYLTENKESMAWVKDYEKTLLHQSQSIVPVALGSSFTQWLGFGFSHPSKALSSQFLLGQVKTTGWFYWEGYGKGKIQPRQDFRHLGKAGPIYQIFIPLFALEPTHTEPRLFRLAQKPMTKNRLIKILKKAILASHNSLRYENSVLHSLHFGDVLYQDGISILDGSGNPPGSPTPGIRPKYSR